MADQTSPTEQEIQATLMAFVCSVFRGHNTPMADQTTPTEQDIQATLMAFVYYLLGIQPAAFNTGPFFVPDLDAARHTEAQNPQPAFRITRSLLLNLISLGPVARATRRAYILSRDDIYNGDSPSAGLAPHNQPQSHASMLPESNNAKRLDAIGYTDGIPDEYICPLMQQIMDDPVLVPGSGDQHCDRANIIFWQRLHGLNLNPFTREALNLALIPTDTEHKAKIDAFVEEAERRQHVFEHVLPKI